MKSFSLVLVLYFFSGIFFHAFAQQNGYTLTGRINELKEGDKVMMMREDYTPFATSVNADSGFVKNGEFKISGKVENGPRRYMLKFYKTGAEHIDQFCLLFIDNNQNIRVSYDGKLSDNVHAIITNYLSVEGSPSNFAFRLYDDVSQFYPQVYDRISHLLEQIQDSVGFDKTAVGQVQQLKRLIKRSFVVNFLDYVEYDHLPAAAYFGYLQSGDHDPALSSLYNQLDDHVKNSINGQRLKKILPLLVGELMPGFSLPDSGGKKIDLSSIISKGRMTLVRFWATNSSGRKESDKQIRALYKLYHDRGLNIIGVSSDLVEEDWKETLQKEQFPWYNVLDRKGKIAVDTVYHELGKIGTLQFTTNVLLDAQGRIIGWNLDGLELQWYIDNYLESKTK